MSQEQIKTAMPGVDSQHLADLVNWAVDHCPVTDAVRRAIPMTVEIHAGQAAGAFWKPRVSVA